jgi:hypothetical protein
MESIPIITGHFSSIACYLGLEYKLISYDNNSVIISGKAKNNSALKKKLKAELVSRGAIFQDEIRPRT